LLCFIFSRELVTDIKQGEWVDVREYHCQVLRSARFIRGDFHLLGVSVSDSHDPGFELGFSWDGIVIFEMIDILSGIVMPLDDSG